MKKLLVLGVSGLTGYKIAQQSFAKFDVYGIYNTRPIKLNEGTFTQLNISDSEQLSQYFSEIQPDIVINTTALHNVDYCEENPQETFRINSEAVKNIQKYSNRYGSKFVHISTDYVFDGSKQIPYKESDMPVPLSEYGRSKLQGEKFPLDSDGVVIRPSVVYGWTPFELSGTTSSSGKPMNFAIWLLSKLNKNEKLSIVTDQFSTATLADTLAKSAIKLAEGNKTGLFHVSGLSCESRYEFSVKFAKKFGYEENQIIPIDSSKFKQKAKRPSYSCLDCTKARDIGLELLNTEDSLNVMKSQVEEEAPHLLGKKV